jgi:protocatechuate 3,4-dioxygenase beta subunit
VIAKRCLPPLLALALAVAQTPSGAPPPAAPSKPEDLCTLAGKVTNAVTGEPVSKVEITIDGRGVQPPSSNVYTTVSDAGGVYHAKGVEPGQYRISAVHAGFVGELRAPEESRRIATLTRAQNATGLDLKLMPEGVIAGRVVNNEGEGMPGYYVTPCLLRYAAESDRQMMIATQGYQETDDRGEFRLYGMPPGSFYLYAGKNSTRSGTDAELDRSSHPREEDYVPTYYPGTTDPLGAAPIRLEPGQTAGGIVVKLVKTHVTNLGGRVVDSAGGAGRRVTLLLLPSAAPFGTVGDRAGAGPHGEFEFRGVPPGSYILEPRAVDGMTQTVYGRQAVTVGQEPADNLAVFLPQEGEIVGQLRVEGEAKLDLHSIKVGLQAPWSPDPHYRVTPVAPDQTGKFLLTGVNPERYALVFQNLPDAFYVKSARMGNTDALESSVDLTSGGAGSVEVVLSGAAAAVAGSVKDANGAAVAGATVALVPQEAARRRMPMFYHSAKSDASGTFSFKGLSPGDYKLYAWQQVEDGAWVSSDFLRSFEASAAAVKLAEGDSPTVDLKVIPSER